MFELRWIMFPLFLMLVFSLTVAVTEKHVYVAVRAGDEVTLSCENVKRDQEKCDSATWIFTDSTDAVPLFEDGQIHVNAKAKSHRLSVTEKCSLVLKEVTVEDGGLYTCRQFKSGEQGPDTQVHLSVVTMTERKDDDAVTLSCSVSSYGWCRHTVRWLYEGEEAAKDKDMTTSWSDCSAAVTFPTSDLKKSKRHELFTCQVTDVYNEKVTLFTFSHPSSGDEATTTTESTPTTGNKGMSVKMSKSEVWWRLIIVSVGLSALLISVVTVSVWTRTKGNKTQREENREHDDEDEDDGTVIYENTGEPSASIRLH